MVPTACVPPTGLPDAHILDYSNRMAKALGLRARKKKDTRRLILKCANALFHDRGFAGTKLADIAAMAGVHKQTVLRYFGSKEEIALAFRQVALGKFKHGLTDPARS